MGLKDIGGMVDGRSCGNEPSAGGSSASGSGGGGRIDGNSCGVLAGGGCTGTAGGGVGLGVGGALLGVGAGPEDAGAVSLASTGLTEVSAELT